MTSVLRRCPTREDERDRHQGCLAVAARPPRRAFIRIGLAAHCREVPDEGAVVLQDAVIVCDHGSAQLRIRHRPRWL